MVIHHRGHPSARAGAGRPGTVAVIIPATTPRSPSPRPSRACWPRPSSAGPRSSWTTAAPTPRVPWSSDRRASTPGSPWSAAGRTGGRRRPATRGWSTPAPSSCCSWTPTTSSRRTCSPPPSTTWRGSARWSASTYGSRTSMLRATGCSPVGGTGFYLRLFGRSDPPPPPDTGPLPAAPEPGHGQDGGEVRRAVCEGARQDRRSGRTRRRTGGRHRMVPRPPVRPPPTPGLRPGVARGRGLPRRHPSPQRGDHRVLAPAPPARRYRP